MESIQQKFRAIDLLQAQLLQITVRKSLGIKLWHSLGEKLGEILTSSSKGESRLPIVDDILKIFWNPERSRASVVNGASLKRVAWVFVLGFDELRSHDAVTANKIGVCDFY